MRLFFALWLFSASIVQAQEDFLPFDLSELPSGTMITLPHPANTMAPLSLELQVQASDRSQILKLSTMAVAGSAQKLKVAIFDQESKAVRRLVIEPGASLLYHFKSMKPIRIVPEKRAAQWKGQRLLLESNRPLGVSHVVDHERGAKAL